MKKKDATNKEKILTACFIRQAELKEKQKSPFTAANYLNAMRSVERFLGEEAATFVIEKITEQWLADYVVYMKEVNGLAPGSASCYLRTLRSVYTKVKSDDLAGKTEGDPFANIHILVPSPAKRTLTKEKLLALLDMDLCHDAGLEKARDLFLFLFCARGMCFVDIFNLQWGDVSDGYICYLRSKTQVPLFVKITREMQVVLDKYREDGSDWLFPHLHRNCYHEDRDVSEKTAIRRINDQLNRLGEQLNLKAPVTTYVARHSWASMSELSGMETSFISKGLGHTSDRITHSYMKGFPSNSMDRENEKMLDCIIRKCENKVKEEKSAEKQTEKQAGSAIILIEKDRSPILCKNERSPIIYRILTLVFISYLPANVCIII